MANAYICRFNFWSVEIQGEAGKESIRDIVVGNVVTDGLDYGIQVTVVDGVVSSYSVIIN